MSAIIVLIVISIVVAMGFLIAFFWAVRSGQYDDEYTPSLRILWDRDKSEENQLNNINQTTTNERS